MEKNEETEVWLRLDEALLMKNFQFYFTILYISTYVLLFIFSIFLSITHRLTITNQLQFFFVRFALNYLPYYVKLSQQSSTSVNQYWISWKFGWLWPTLMNIKKYRVSVNKKLISPIPKQWRALISLPWKFHNDKCFWNHIFFLCHLLYNLFVTIWCKNNKLIFYLCLKVKEMVKSFL